MFDIEPTIVTLTNGIRVVYLHASTVVAHMGVTILAGSRYENSNEEGLAHFWNIVFLKAQSEEEPFIFCLV